MNDLVKAPTVPPSCSAVPKNMAWVPTANPKSVPTAINAATRIWDGISQHRIQKLVDGYRARLQEVIDNDGGPTSWLGKNYKED